MKLWIAFVGFMSGMGLIAGFLLLSLLFSGTAAADADDPFESVNRPIFELNQQADRFVLRPVARAYEDYTPEPIKTGMGNVLLNFSELGSTVNFTLQGRFMTALRSGGRFAINSTVGFFGILDVAGAFGLDRRSTSLAQTLDTWGLEEGPYVVLPLFGPSTLRNGVAFGVEALVLSVPAQIGTDVAVISGFGGAVDTRAELLAFDQLVTGDEYVFYREAYLQQSVGVSASHAIDDFASSDAWDGAFE
ncbi:MAG: VacJ family lipoprotein [Pseudomonadota bacterium]